MASMAAQTEYPAPRLPRLDRRPRGGGRRHPPGPGPRARPAHRPAHPHPGAPRRLGPRHPRAVAPAGRLLRLGGGRRRHAGHRGGGHARRRPPPLQCGARTGASGAAPHPRGGPARAGTAGGRVRRSLPPARGGDARGPRAADHPHHPGRPQSPLGGVAAGPDPARPHAGPPHAESVSVAVRPTGGAGLADPGADRRAGGAAAGAAATGGAALRPCRSTYPRLADAMGLDPAFVQDLLDAHAAGT